MMTTNIHEMAEFFPSALRQGERQVIRGVRPLLPGETTKQAQQRHDATTARIERKNADRLAAMFQGEA